jgi:hypothetical protein
MELTRAKKARQTSRHMEGCDYGQHAKKKLQRFKIVRTRTLEENNFALGRGKLCIHR